MNKEAMEEAWQGSDQGMQAVFWTRGGPATSPGAASLMWLGDQLPTWDQHDGLKTVLRATLSLGLSGFSLTHSDIGGFDIIRVRLGPLTVVDYNRTEELLQRWVELSAFLDAIMRTHPGSSPNATLQIYSTLTLLRHFSRFTKIHAALGEYKGQLMEEAHATGWPLARHTGLHYPSAPGIWNQTSQFLLGRDFLAAPVLDEASTVKGLYLPPEDEWIDVWSGKAVPTRGFVTVHAPVGRPPLFLRGGACHAAAAAAAVIRAL